MICDDFGYSGRCLPVDPLIRHVRNMTWVDVPIVQPLGAHSGRRYILSYTVDVWWLVECEMCVMTIWQASRINCHVNVLRGRCSSHSKWHTQPPIQKSNEGMGVCVRSGRQKRAKPSLRG